MKNLPLVFLVTVWAYPTPDDDQYHIPELDNVDIDEALNNPRIFNNYFNCFKTGKKCTSAGGKIRDILPEMLQTGCAKCTENQRRRGKKVLDFTLKNHPDKFLVLEKIHDPETKYRKIHAKELADEGIVLPD